MTFKSFDYLPYDLENPEGSNSLGSLANYFERKLYAEAIYPDASPRPLDTWYGKIYYGKVDRNQVIVLPRQNSLATVRSSGQLNARANLVVAGQFNNFVTHMRQASIVGAIDTEATENLFDLKIYDGYRSPATEYEKYLNRVFDAFNNSLSDMQKNEIKTFADYMNKIISYLEDLAAYAPVTKSTFILTPLNSRFGSGLTIGIARGEVEEDAYKFRRFLSDPNFEFYSRCAKKYGFIVDKNIPWLLSADLFTDAFTIPLGQYHDQEYNPLTKDNFFDVFFEPSCETDIQDLRNFILNSYDLFIRRNSLREEITHGDCGLTQVELIERSFVGDGEGGQDQALTDKKLIDFYINLRHTETKEPFRLTGELRYKAEQAYRSPPRAEVTPLGNAAHVVATRYRPYVYDPSYFKIASLEALNFMVLGLDKASTSANMGNGEPTSTSAGPGDSSSY